MKMILHGIVNEMMAVSHCILITILCILAVKGFLKTDTGKKIVSSLYITQVIYFQVTYNTLLRARTRYGSLHEVQQCLSIYQDMRKAGYVKS